MPYQIQYNDSTEPFHDTDAEILGNAQLYGVLNGCAVTLDSADMTWDIAAGQVLINGQIINVAAQTNVSTVSADATNPRWVSFLVDNTGTASAFAGTAAAAPLKPEINGGTNPENYVEVYAARVQAGLTILNNAGTRLDKRVPIRYPGYQGTDIASAATLSLPSGGGDVYDVTGTTTITALPTNVPAGVRLTLQFDGSLTLTHNATSLILIGGQSIQTQAGDVFTFVSRGSNNWQMVAWGRAGLMLVGSDTTERTTTSVAATDLSTVSNLNIAATTPVLVAGIFRKTSGAAAASGLGLVINATTVEEAATTNALLNSSAGNQAEDGAFWWYIPPRATNYTQGLMGINIIRPSSGGTTVGNSGVVSISLDAGAPIATITSITIRGISGDAAVTTAVDEVRVYALGT